jgi:hypothetical protein
LNGIPFTRRRLTTRGRVIISTIDSDDDALRERSHNSSRRTALSDNAPTQKRGIMPSIRDLIDPSGRMLARRLAQFCDTLQNLGARLRGTIASAIGETIGVIIRDTALLVLDDVPHYFRASDSFSSPWRRYDHDMHARHEYDDERGYWDDDQYQANMHSTPTTRPARKGAMALRKASGLAGRSRSKTVAPA